LAQHRQRSPYAATEDRNNTDLVTFRALPRACGRRTTVTEDRNT
jgi:hypothetical protein